MGDWGVEEVSFRLKKIKNKKKVCLDTTDGQSVPPNEQVTNNDNMIIPPPPGIFSDYGGCKNNDG